MKSQNISPKMHKNISLERYSINSNEINVNIKNIQSNTSLKTTSQVLSNKSISNN